MDSAGHGLEADRGVIDIEGNDVNHIRAVVQSSWSGRLDRVHGLH